MNTPNHWTVNHENGTKLPSRNQESTGRRQDLSCQLCQLSGRHTEGVG